MVAYLKWRAWESTTEIRPMAKEHWKILHVSTGKMDYIRFEWKMISSLATDKMRVF